MLVKSKIYVFLGFFKPHSQNPSFPLGLKVPEYVRLPLPRLFFPCDFGYHFIYYYFCNKGYKINYLYLISNPLQNNQNINTLYIYNIYCTPMTHPFSMSHHYKCFEDPSGDDFDTKELSSSHASLKDKENITSYNYNHRNCTIF